MAEEGEGPPLRMHFFLCLFLSASPCFFSFLSILSFSGFLVNRRTGSSTMAAGTAWCYVSLMLFYPATCGPKGHGSSSDAAEAAAVLLLHIVLTLSCPRPA